MRRTHTVPFAPSPIGARWAYGEACGLLLIASWQSAAGAIYAFTRITGATWNPHTVSATITGGQLVSSVVLFFWLNLLVIGRTPPSMATARRMTLRLLAVAVGASAVATAVPDHGFSRSPFLGLFVFSAGLVWLTVEICLRHGITPTRLGAWPLRPVTAERREEWKNIADSTAVALAAGGGGAFILVSVLQGAGLTRLVMPGTQQQALGMGGIGEIASALIFTVVLEDLIMVAAVVALLTAARRRAWEIYTIICIAEVAVHLYFGLPALAFLPYAWLRIRLYRRHVQVIPMLAVHLAFDTFGILMWTLPFTFTERLLCTGAGIALFLAVDFLRRRVPRRLSHREDDKRSTIAPDPAS
ncbi:hypothetical protein [Streptomyces sp. IB2014 016-6]|uniref:hypothetical protein n=1 Tax=Streptomyces sp. IB2014 016-6 TaxID=2517818 RepID=UPI0011C821D9|nr:hypothetical protein [Streptomyces sp. IB2014 016-6]TXL83949.1 hypothetical protein EW053_35895 [Streptomyces sp. IB2014 016-6]